MEDYKSFADTPVLVDFTLNRNGQVSITTQEYADLMKYARSYTVGYGKSSYTFHIVHTTAGYISLQTKKAGAIAVWIADNFSIKAVVADSSSNHYTDIDTGTRTVRIPFEGFLPNKIDAALFSKGIAISKTNKAHEVLSMHLQWLLGKFEIQDAKMILGWRYKNDHLTWSGINGEPPMLKYRLDLPSQEDYIKKLNELISGCHGLQFALCSAAASTVLAYLNMTAKLPVASFGVSLVGTSSTGKTTALQLAASLYSSPDDESVYSGFYGTSNALIYMLGRHHGVPLCYDESTIENNINKASFVYAFAGGQGKLRLNQQNQLKEHDKWLCTCLFSSETHLVDLANNDNLGLGVRILNLENYIYTRNSSHADEIKTFAATNHGIVGNLLAEYLLNTNKAEVLHDYNTLKTDIGSYTGLNRCSLTDRLILNFALIIYTAAILNNIGISMNIKSLLDICVEINNKAAESADPGKNIICKVFNYISSKYKHIKGIKWTTDKDGCPTKVAIVETTFCDILNECKINDVKGAINHLDKSGYLIRQSSKRIKSKLSIDGVPCYAYQFDMEKVNEAFGTIDDDAFSNVRKYTFVDRGTDEVLNIVNDEEAIIHEGNYKINSNKGAVSGKAFLL